MKPYIYLAIAYCMLVICFSKAEEVTRLPFADRMIFMFLDTTEIASNFLTKKGFEAVSENLLQALDQHVPIITTPSLMYNVALARDLYNHAPQLSLEALHSRYITTSLLPPTTNVADYKKYITAWKNTYDWSINELSQITAIPEHLDKNQYKKITVFSNWQSSPLKATFEQLDKQTRDKTNVMLRAFVSTFNPQEWICKKINKTLMLLIPKKAFPDISLTDASTKYIPTATDISDLEYALGIKINHMETITPQNILNPLYYKNNYDLGKPVDLEPQNIFVTKSHYPKNIAIPSWGIYINAHGAIPLPLQPEIDKLCKLFAELFKSSEFTCEKISEKILAQAKNAHKTLNDLNTLIQKLIDSKDGNAWLSSKDSISTLLTSYLNQAISIQQEIGFDISAIQNLQKRLQDSNKKYASPSALSLWISEVLTIINSALTSSANNIILPLAINEDIIKKLDYYTMLKKNGMTYIHHFGGFSTSELKDILNFFNNHLSTRFVILSACYIGGQVLKFLQKSSFDLDKNYSYPLVALGIVDAPTQISTTILAPYLLENQDLTNNTIKNIYETSLDKAFVLSTRPKKDAFTKFPTSEILLRTDWSSLTEIVEHSIDRNLVSNFAQIKMPGLNWTQPVNIQELAVSIYPTLATTHKGTLDISRFFGGKKQRIYPQAILLYAQTIPFALKISKNPAQLKSMPPAILSSIQGNAVHHIKEIKAPQFTLEEILKSFFTVSGIIDHKLFLIDNIITSDNPQGITNVVIFNNMPLKSSDIHYNGFAYQPTPLSNYALSAQWPANTKIPTSFTLNNIKPFEIHVELENFTKKHGFWTAKDVSLPQKHHKLIESLQKKETVKMNYDLQGLAHSLSILGTVLKK